MRTTIYPYIYVFHPSWLEDEEFPESWREVFKAMVNNGTAVLSQPLVDSDVLEILGEQR